MGLASLGATDDEISKLVRSFLFSPEFKCPQQKNTMIVNTMMVNTMIVLKISFLYYFTFDQVSCYFFTVEFGLCQEGDQMKVRTISSEKKTSYKRVQVKVETKSLQLKTFYKGLRGWPSLFSRRAAVCDGRHRVRLPSTSSTGGGICLQR